MPPHPTLYVRRDWFDKIGNYNTKMKIAADYDLQRAQVENALEFYKAHRSEIDAAIAAEIEIERQSNPDEARPGEAAPIYC